MSDKLSINDVIDEVQNWLEEEFNSDMSPSEYRKVMEILDDMSMMDFDEILESYPSLSNRFYDEFDFVINEDEFVEKLDSTIKDHITYLEETCRDYNSDDEEWY